MRALGPRADEWYGSAVVSGRRGLSLILLVAVSLPLVLGCALPAGTPSSAPSPSAIPSPTPVRASHDAITVEGFTFTITKVLLSYVVDGALPQGFAADDMVLDLDITSGVVDQSEEAEFEDALSRADITDETGRALGYAAGYSPSLMAGSKLVSPSIMLIFGPVPKTTKSLFLWIQRPSSAQAAAGRGGLVDLSPLLVVTTATPRPTPIPNLGTACAGTPISDAAPYGGTVHPLVVLGGTFSHYDFEINAKVYRDRSYGDDWIDQAWPGPIQLILCVGDEQTVKVRSCGKYQTAITGQVGEVILYKYARTVRVVVALTGKVLQAKVIDGSVLSCESTYSLGGNPPWEIHGQRVDLGAINTYATSVATQAVK